MAFLLVLTVEHHPQCFEQTPPTGAHGTSVIRQTLATPERAARAGLGDVRERGATAGKPCAAAAGLKSSLSSRQLAVQISDFLFCTSTASLPFDVLVPRLLVSLPKF